jgi:hypothetical protein
MIRCQTYRGRIAILAVTWAVMTLLALLADYVGVRFLHCSDLWGMSVPLALFIAPIAFGWPFHVRGSRHLLSYQALGLVLLVSIVWYWSTLHIAILFHIAIGGELHL